MPIPLKKRKWRNRGRFVKKNIPGINVDSNGKINIGGKEVEKVMVEGDDLFEKRYKLLTKNLDASVINKSGSVWKIFK